VKLFFFPEHDVTIEAESLDEALKKLKAPKKKSTSK